jgi:hypothetical protein
LKTGELGGNLDPEERANGLAIFAMLILVKEPPKSRSDINGKLGKNCNMSEFWSRKTPTAGLNKVILSLEAGWAL